MATDGHRKRRNRNGCPSCTALLAALCLLLPATRLAAQDEPPKLEPGQNVTVSTRSMDLAAFLELLSVSYKLNIVSPKDITGKVSVNFYDVPPLEALQAVLEANGYQYILEKTTGSPIIKIQQIQKVEGAVAVVMRTFELKYATAADVQRAAANLVTKNGSITTAAAKNTVIVQDVPDAIARIEALVKTLDAPPRQVMIDAKLVELGKTDLEETGFNWSMFQKMNIADITAESSYARVAEWVDTSITGTPSTSTRDIVRTTGTNVDLRAGILSENSSQLVLDFFDTLTNTTIISRPSIRTLDNKEAHIISGQIVPIPMFDFAKDTGVRTLSGFQDEQIGVELTVTPHINQDGYITLEVNPKVESIERYISVGGDEQRPVRNTRQATTTIRIKDGQTAVIGGLTSSSLTDTSTGLPWFKDLPGIGFLFRNKSSNLVVTELIVFITPKTVDDSKDEPLTEGQKGVLKQVDAAGITK